MERIEALKEQIRALSPEELATFRDWFARFDAEVWDRQLESDIAAGKLDHIADRALRSHRAGQSTRR